MHINDVLEDLFLVPCWDITCNTHIPTLGMSVPSYGLTPHQLKFKTFINLLTTAPKGRNDGGIYIVSSELIELSEGKKIYDITCQLLYGKDTKRILKSLAYRSGPKKRKEI